MGDNHAHSPLPTSPRLSFDLFFSRQRAGVIPGPEWLGKEGFDYPVVNANNLIFFIR